MALSTVPLMVPGRLPVCVLNDTRAERHHGCTRVMGAILDLLAANGFDVLATCPVHCDWQQDARFLQALESTRLVVVNGEGTIHHERPEGRTLLSIGQWARSRGIPAVLLNAGWEANGAELARMAGDFALAAARDSVSRQELARHGIDCREVPDLSLYAECPGRLAARSDGIFFTDSVDRLAALKLERTRRDCAGETLSITYPAPGVTGYLRFMRQGLARRDLGSPRRSAELLMMRHRLYARSHRSVDAFLGELAKASLLVAGRFHACTLALVTGTPFVAVPSNTGKIAALVRDAGLEAWRSQETWTRESILEARRRGWTATERRAIDDYLGHARQETGELFADIRRLV